MLTTSRQQLREKCSTANAIRNSVMKEIPGKNPKKKKSNIC